MNKKWHIEIVNIFNRKRKKGIVTGDLARIRNGLASSGWDIILALPAEHMTHGV
jgi:superfamily I DNA and RNA helicase